MANTHMTWLEVVWHRAIASQHSDPQSKLIHKLCEEYMKAIELLDPTRKYDDLNDAVRNYMQTAVTTEGNLNDTTDLLVHVAKLLHAITCPMESCYPLCQKIQNVTETRFK